MSGPKRSQAHDWHPSESHSWKIRHALKGTKLSCPTDVGRWAAFVDKTDDCWLWTGTINNAGRPTFRFQGGPVYAYRFAFEATYGPIPPGLTIDHLCCEPKCVRPDHLEAVTTQENTRRYWARVRGEAA